MPRPATAIRLKAPIRSLEATMSRSRLYLLLPLVLSLGLAAFLRPAYAEQSGSVRTRVAFASIAAGGAHTCAIVTGGRVRCWGYNIRGELGSTTHLDDMFAMTPDPQPAVPLGAPATALAAGSYHSCALLAGGAVRCWGFNHGGQLGSATNNGGYRGDPAPQPPVALGAPAVAITAGDSHTCALLGTGRVRCWGDNSHGQLGSTVNEGSVDAANPQPLPSVPLGARAVAISAGNFYTCALLATGTVRCWGGNERGELGSSNHAGDTVPVPTPQSVPLGSATVAISASGEHTCALLATGAVRCWGWNYNGELGSATHNGILTATPTPQPAVPLGAPAVGISAGGDHTCALLSTGAVRCWGRNVQGQLGSADGYGTPDPHPTPATPVPIGGRVVSLVSAWSFSCAVTADSRAYCWGYDADGELGRVLPGGISTPTPDSVPLTGLRVVAPARLTLVAQPGTDRVAPYAFALHGQVRGPLVTDAATCRGTVRVQVHLGSRLLTTRRVSLSPDCSWRATAGIPVRLLRVGRNSLTVRAHLGATTNLAAADASTGVVAVR